MKVKERIKKMFFLGFQQFQDPYYQGVAAQVAFFFMLSIVPTLILLSQLLGLLHIPISNMNDYMDAELTPEIVTELQELLKFEPQTTSNIILILTAIWAASRLQFTLMRVANYTLSEGRDPGTFFRDRLRSLATVALTVVTIVLMIIVLVYGQLIFRFFEERIVLSKAYGSAWRYFRWPIAGALYLLLLSFNYYVLPHERGSFKDVIPGSIFCAMGMLVVTIIYSYYTAKVVNNNVIYGSMASIAALMFWFYFISWVMILGIFFNKVWIDTREDSHDVVTVSSR